MSIDSQKGGEDNTPKEKNEGGRSHISYMDILCSILEGVERKEGDTSKSLTGIYGVSPSDVRLGEVFSLITTDSYVKRMTDKCRRLTGMGKSDDASACKRMEQHCFFPSARMEGGTKDANCAECTNIVMADYDHLDPAEVERCRELLRTDEHCLMMYKTIRGHGLHILVPVMGVCSKETHKIAWEQVNAYYDNLLGLKHDASCANIARKSILAHDPDALCNLAPVPMYIDYSALVKDRKPGRPFKGVHHSLEEVGAELDRYMKARNLKYMDGQRNCYVFNAACELNRYGVDMEEVIDFFNEKAHDLPEREIRQAVESAYKRYPEQHGTKRPYKEGEEKKPSKTVNIGDVEEYMLAIADYRHNLITLRYEIRWKDETEWEEMTDSTFNDIWRKVCKEIKHVNNNMIRSIIESSFSKPYNPFVSSLESLKPWDGVTDHIGVMADMVHIKPDCQNYFLFKDAFKKWLVAAVASICDPKAYNKKILTLVGKQDTYKTTFLSKLYLPSWTEKSVHVKNSFREFNKDERLLMASSPIYCLDEISSMSTSFTNELKSLTSQTSINERRAYGHYTESYPRISSFCATSNYISFLTDMTGNNRFLIYEVDGIDCPFNIPVELKEAMWRQAYQLYNDGFQYWFTKEEDERIDQQNERYTLDSPEEELIMTYYAKPQYGEQYKIVNITNIIERISYQYKGSLKPVKVKQALLKLGFQYKRTNSQRGYMVKENTQTEISMHQQSSDWSHLPPSEDTAQAEEQAILF